MPLSAATSHPDTLRHLAAAQHDIQDAREHHRKHISFSFSSVHPPLQTTTLSTRAHTNTHKTTTLHYTPTQSLRR